MVGPIILYAQCEIEQQGNFFKIRFLNSIEMVLKCTE